MGVNLSTIVNETTQVGYANVLQSTRTTCLAKCAPTTRNVNVIVTGNSSIGDIVITQECTAEAMCTIKTELETVALQTFDSVNYAELQSSGPTGWLAIVWPGWRINTTVNTTEQYLYNNITQVINNSCVALSSPEIENVNVFVSDNSTVGNFTIEQQATSVASCQIESVANAYSYQDASSSQSGGISYGSTLALILVVVLAVITTIIVIYLNLQGSKAKREQEIKLYQAQAEQQKPLVQAQANIAQAQAQTQLDIIRAQMGLPPLTIATTLPPPPSPPQAITSQPQPIIYYNYPAPAPAPAPLPPTSVLNSNVMTPSYTTPLINSALTQQQAIPIA